MQAASAGGK